MLSRLGFFLSKLFRKLIPHTFVLAVLLTAVVAVASLAFTPVRAGELLDIWAGWGSHPLMRLEDGGLKPWVVRKIEEVEPGVFRLEVWKKTPPQWVADSLMEKSSEFGQRKVWVKGRSVYISGVSRKDLEEELVVRRVEARIKGIWQFLAFSMQMCLILLTGYAIAVSGPVRRFLKVIANIPRDGGSAAAWIAVISMLAGWLNWGVGLIVGAYLAREIASQAEQRGIPMHYPLLGAAGYTGLLIWHGGLSGSAPLKVAEKYHLTRELGLNMPPIPLTETIFHPMNIAISLGLLFAIPFLCRAMAPSDPTQIMTFRTFVSYDLEGEVSKAKGAHWLERWRGINYLLAIPMLLFFFSYLWRNGFNLSINLVILLFFAVGLLLYRGVRAYASHLARGAKSCVSIIIQFPLYAGIFAMLYETGLADIIAGLGKDLSSPSSFLLTNFFISSLLNIFIPSGGGQWGIQGGISLTMAQEMNIPPGLAVMTVAYGDQWSNMLQPFWALALLDITGLRARDILGYTVVLMLASGVLFVIGILLFSSIF